MVDANSVDAVGFQSGLGRGVDDLPVHEEINLVARYMHFERVAGHGARLHSVAGSAGRRDLRRGTSIAALDQPGAPFFNHEVDIGLTGALQIAASKNQAIVFRVAHRFYELEGTLEREISRSGV